MKVSNIVALLTSISISQALVTLNNSQCSSFAQNISLAEDNATILNSTYHYSNTVNVTSNNQQIYNSFGFCEVNCIVGYGKNSSLHFSVYLPDAVSYNGRFMAVGNGGMAGTIDKVAMLQQLNSGFATAGGDAGHLAALNNEGSGAPDTFIPYLHNEDQEARYSYYSGCSTGGAQGFALAQYHPELFDGIVAGCPGNWYSHLALSFLWNAQKSPVNSSSYLSQAALNLTGAAVLKACDSIDGVEDGVIEDPLRCNFNVDTLACAANTTSGDNGDGDIACLTTEQIAAVKAIYAGPVNSQTGQQLYPGFSHGSEIQWILQEGDLSDSFSVPILQNLVYNNLSYDTSSFDWASDVSDVNTRAGALIDAIDVNLTAFRDRGGKMLVYQGWSDPFNAQTWPIQHLEDIQNFFAGDVSDFYNLFMIPGGGHCGAASFYPNVPATYHTVPQLVKWVERGGKPTEILTTNPSDGSTRSHKLCPWPQTAVYVQGDINDWNSFTCED